MLTRYRWKRFWCPPTGQIDLSDGGYLVDPTSKWGGFSETDVVRQDKLHGIDCLALLGDPGMGKSVSLDEELNDARSRLVGTGDEILPVDLRSATSDVMLMRKIFDAPKFRAWEVGTGRLHLYLDSLDECILMVDHVATILIDELMQRKGLLDRMVLRIACRSASWPAFLDEQLKEVWGEKRTGVFELAPLRRADVAAAATAEGLSSDGFLEEVTRKGAVPLAIKPITLRFLLDSFRDDGSLASDVTSLYEEGLRRLCEERNLSRRAAGRVGTLTAGQRLDLATRVGGVTVFGDYTAIWTGLAEDAKEGDVRIDQLVGWEPPEDGIEVTGERLDEMLDTGLFSLRGAERLGWAHRSFEEYCAARYLVRRGVAHEEIMTLLAPSGAIVPQLIEVAAWLANLAPGMRPEFQRRAPGVLLHADLLSMDEGFRAGIVGDLLSAYEAGEVVDPYAEERVNLRKLAHGHLADQLRPFLTDQHRRRNARAFAINIAWASEERAVLPDLTGIALDRSEERVIRVAAAHAVARFGDQDSQSKLRPLALGQAGDDPDDELKGYGLTACWPWAFAPEERFTVLTPQKASNFAGGYWGFLNLELDQRLRLGDLPEALQWLSSDARVSLSGLTFRMVQDKIVLRSLEHLRDSTVLASLARLFATRIAADRRNLDRENEARFAELIGRDDEARRNLIDALLPLVVGRPQSAFRLVSAGASIVLRRDTLWLLERLRSEQEGRVRAFIRELIGWIADRNDATQMAAVSAAIADDPPLASEFPEPRLGSGGSPESAHPAPTGSQDEPLLLIKQLLKQFQVGSAAKTWWPVNVILARGNYGPLAGAELSADVRELRYWTALNVPTHNRLVDIAEAYLREVDPGTASWIGAEFYPGEAFAGARALRLVASERPSSTVLTNETWARWVPSIFVSTIGNSEVERRAVRDLVSAAFRAAPEAVLASAGLYLSGRDHLQRDLDVWMFERCQGRGMECLLLELAQSSDISPMSLRVLLTALIHRDNREGIQYATSLVTSHERGADIAASARAVAAAAALAVGLPDASWGPIRAVIDGDEAFGRALFEETVGSIGGRDLAAGLTEDQLADAYIWLQSHYPPFDPSRFSVGVHWVSTQERVQDWGDAIPRGLAGKGTLAASDALRRLVEALPEHEWLRELLRQSQEEVIRHSWAPRPVNAILALGTARSKAGVESILAAGDRSVAVGGNVQGAVITGDLMVTINLAQGMPAAEEPDSG